MTEFDETKSHPPTRWFRLAQRLFPGRCREVPHPEETDRVLIRQFALVKRYAYLQQFASGEGVEWAHSHSWELGTVAIGLSGAVWDYRHVDGRYRAYTAPYFRYMGPGHIHATTRVDPGHTSLFIGLGKKNDALKNYFPQVSAAGLGHLPVIQRSRDGRLAQVELRRSWRQHIQRLTKRI